MVLFSAEFLENERYGTSYFGSVVVTMVYGPWRIWKYCAWNQLFFRFSTTLQWTPLALQLKIISKMYSFGYQRSNWNRQRELYLIQNSLTGLELIGRYRIRYFNFRPWFIKNIFGESFRSSLDKLVHSCVEIIRSYRRFFLKVASCANKSRSALLVTPCTWYRENAVIGNCIWKADTFGALKKNRKCLKF